MGTLKYLAMGATALALMGAAPASATVVNWNLSAPTGTLGTTQAYTTGPYTITASGFTNDTSWTPTALYGKNAGGNEIGLGINSDPSGNGEIWGVTLVQIDVSAASALGVSGYNFSMGSSTGGENWNVYGSNDTGVGASLSFLLTGTNDQSVHSLTGGYKYYDFFYGNSPNATGGDNVLLHTFAGSVPEPSTWAMMLLGFAGLGFAAFRRSRKSDLSIVSA